MMNPLNSLILGIVQGVTEFLPISSSGHLILMRDLLGANTENGLAFDAVLQLGTICAVFACFWKDVAQLITAALRLMSGKAKPEDEKNKTLILAIICGTVPAVIGGLLLEKTMESIFRSAFLVSITLILGSLLLFAAERFGKRKQSEPTVAQGGLIGLFQTLALIPGVSRSGSTISAGMLLGLTRGAATRFSFLLSLPIITGSGLYKLLKIAKMPPADFSAIDLAIGFTVSALVGYVCIRWLLRYLANHSLDVFAWYRITVGTIVLIALAVR